MEWGTVLKQNNKKFPLSVYIACSFLIFSIILLIIIWLFQTVLLDPFYRTIKTHQVENCAKSVVHNINEEDLYSILLEIEEQNDMSVSLYDTTNEFFVPLYTPKRFMSASSMINRTSIYQYYRTAVANGGEATLKSTNEKIIQSYNFHGFEPPLDKKYVEVYASATVFETNSRQYMVLVESEITPVTSTVETLRFQLIIITIIIILISIIIAILTAHYLSKPVRETNEKAKQLAKQNYDITFQGGNYKELCELNDTLTFSAQELSKVDKLRKELIANISHDLRTPLTMITGYSEVMRDLPGENTPENIQIIIDEANRLSSLVSDLLDISKLESDAISMENSVFNLTECIKGIFMRYTTLIKQSNYNIVFEHDRDVYIYADPLRISQVMYNLINNAINYCGNDKTVIIRQKVSDNKVTIEVEDHGVGIEADKLDYIWDRYYKVDKEHKQAVIGTGLGLSIVKNILLKYNAQFGVNSRINEGSVFWFVMPLAEINPDDNI